MRDSGPILVPLDGSELSEGALPYAKALADALGAQLTLLCVWDGSERDLAETFPSLAVDIDAKAHEHYNDYLKQVKERFALDADAVVREGDPGAVILSMAEELGARIIAIGTHGRSGVGRWFAGSTATHVLRHANTPLLAVGPEVLQHPRGSVSYKHLMTPLDGTPLSEQALPVATKLASALGARLSLVRCVQWAVQAYPYTLPSTYVPQVDDELEKGAKAYLRRQEEAVKGQGVEVSAFVVRGPIAQGLFEFIDKESVDLVIMTTHARGGLARVALGSVADRMLQANAPSLLIRPQEA
jgi:nucleotide-binding universal stress UspA family protein